MEQNISKSENGVLLELERMKGMYKLFTICMVATYLAIFVTAIVAIVVVKGNSTSQIESLQEENQCLTRRLTQSNEMLEEAHGLLESVVTNTSVDQEGLEEDIADYMDAYELFLTEENEEVNLDPDDSFDFGYRDFLNDATYSIKKPIIYVYPEESTCVNIGLSNPEKLTCSYPYYDNGWTVDVDEDGTIQCNGREYYGLYWEGAGAVVDDITEGFCVEGKDTTSFLEDKLHELGLSEREANEFIIYWLPKLESNPYNIIYFASIEEQNDYMSLDITPVPDTLIRVNMVWKASDEFVSLPEQKINSSERNGYTVVEWGGTELK